MGQRKASEAGEWKGDSPVISILRLLIRLDRGPCYTTTSDLHKQPEYSDHYIRTSQIIVAITTMKPELTGAAAACWIWQSHL